MKKENPQWGKILKGAMVNHRTAALSSLPFASLPSSFIHLRTAAPEHFNACQQYVQQTCCACKQTQTHTQAESHIHIHYAHTHTQSHHQAGISDKLFPISLSEQNNKCGTHGTNFPGLTEFNWQTVQWIITLQRFQNKHSVVSSLTDDTSALISTSQLQRCALTC